MLSVKELRSHAHEIVCARKEVMAQPVCTMLGFVAEQHAWEPAHGPGYYYLHAWNQLCIVG